MRNLLIISLILFSNLVFSQVKFNSGSSTIESFLKQQTVYPPYSKQNCIQGTVTVSFKINKAGVINTPKVDRGVLGDLDEEALRLIKLTSGKWQVSPSYDTLTNIILPVNFVLSGFNCESKAASDITNAKLAYRAEAGMIDAVTNFYKNRDQASPEQEAQIIAIKKQLGIDDEYLNNRIKNGLEKWKQGDSISACEEFNFVKNTGSSLADEYLNKYCK